MTDRLLTPTQSIYVIERGDWEIVGAEEPETRLTLILPDDPVLIAAVRKVSDSFDELTCQSLACSGEGENPVGWYLATREDTYGAEHASGEFAYTAVVVEHAQERAWLMCEDCHASETLLPVIPDDEIEVS